MYRGLLVDFIIKKRLKKMIFSFVGHKKKTCYSE